MQALRTGALAQGSLRAIRGGTRASTGRGWYQRYKRMGPDAFRKARAPNPFDWDAPATLAPVGQEGEESERRKPRRRAFFDMAVDGVPAGRVEFELASDVLPVTSENFLRLCDGVAVASSSSPPPAQQREGGGGGEAEAAEEEQEAEEERLCYEGSVVSLHVLPEVLSLYPWITHRAHTLTLRPRSRRIVVYAPARYSQQVPTLVRLTWPCCTT